MGQGHAIINLDKKECILTDALEIGDKAREQLFNHPSTPQMLFIVLMCSNGRGGGDLRTAGPLFRKVFGRWAGDRIAVVGDRAKDKDLRVPASHPASELYMECHGGEYRDITPLVWPVLESEFEAIGRGRGQG
jgi:hypothetical protein